MSKFGSGDNEAAFDRIADALETVGYIIIADCLPFALSEALCEQSIHLDGKLDQAGVGRGRALTVDGSIRTDGICWLNPDNLELGKKQLPENLPRKKCANSIHRLHSGKLFPSISLAEIAYLAWMEQLRLGLNRRLFLGLFDYESHFAVYEVGGSYRKHLDAFQGVSNRVLSTVFYLNPSWLPNSCGELLIHAPVGDALVETVLPAFGTMAIFLSAVFPHEVAITHRKRYSIAGWFRGRQ